MKIGLQIIFAILLVGCATPVSHTNIPLNTYDKDTEYGLEERDDGFAITVLYSRYQYFPESDALGDACKSMLTAIAHEVADGRGKPINQINEQKIRLSFGRNGITGITSCQAYAVAEYR
jgi:hypothetical protein